MTKKLQNPSCADEGKTRKRILKPVVEKKRRDRINQSLAELRHLLLDHTADPRLQNSKLEKAEILDLTVEYLRKWTEGKNFISGSTDGPTEARNLRGPEPGARALSAVESAGFQRCVARLHGYIHRMSPEQRAGLMEGMKRHAGARQPGPESGQNVADDAASLGSVCTSESGREEAPPPLPSLSPFQPHSCSTPGHDFLSPPPSPWFSPSFSTYALSPTFPSFASHFSHPPCLSPPSSNTSFLHVSPTGPHTGPSAFHFPPLTTVRSSPHLTQRLASPPSSAAMWRPWSRD
ncbi:transcription factor HES-7-like [Betta splendens]|uniref:Transcription factor HES-7-like n=1 Tax=Betta splendens TaxID=158456 RepID=A0A6P7NUW2_BETSP|nr:transcription factor HES-7-like [Betta splendens]